MSIEKTCENCEYEYVSQYGLPCIKCIHNGGDVEKFELKAKYVERGKTVDEFKEVLIGWSGEKSFKVELDGEETDVITVDDFKDLVISVAELLKGGSA